MTDQHTPFYYYRRLQDNFKGAKGCSVCYDAGERVTLRYHETDVARYNFDTGELDLDHGGWRTYYTKERINRFCDVLGLPVGVYQSAKRFYVALYSDTPEALRCRTIDWGHIDDGDAPTVSLNVKGVPCS